MKNDNSLRKHDGYISDRYSLWVSREKKSLVNLVIESLHKIIVLVSFILVFGYAQVALAEPVQTSVFKSENTQTVDLQDVDGFSLNEIKPIKYVVKQNFYQHKIVSQLKNSETSNLIYFIMAGVFLMLSLLLNVCRVKGVYA